MKYLGLGAILIFLCTVMYSSVTNAVPEVSRSYTISNNSVIEPGNLVSTQGNGDSVILADTDNGKRLVGVVVPSNNSLLDIDSATGLKKVQVATSGNVVIFVSNVGGDIHAGDAVAVSPLSGIGMEASGSLRTIGIAQANFNTSTTGTKSSEVKDKAGHTHRIVIGSIPVVINIGNGTIFATQSGILGGLQGIAEAVVGHQVSVLQAVISFLVTVIAIGALVALVYGAIHAGIIAIGRNPLARDSIYKSLLQVMFMALLLVIVTVAILYFTLR